MATAHNFSTNPTSQSWTAPPSALPSVKKLPIVDHVNCFELPRIVTMLQVTRSNRQERGSARSCFQKWGGCPGNRSNELQFGGPGCVSEESEFCGLMLFRTVQRSQICEYKDPGLAVGI